MSIEFHCASCGQTLRVSEEAAGKRARCPRCQHINNIPTPVEEVTVDEDLGLQPLPEVPVRSPGGSPFGDEYERDNPYASPKTGYEGVGAAGGEFASGGRIINVPTDIGSVLNYSIAVWQKHLGILVGATVVVIAINMAASYGLTPIIAVLQHNGQKEVAAIVNILGSLGGWLIQVYLGVGLTQIMLKLARNQPTEFTDLFNGGSLFLPALGVSVLFGFVVVLGCVMLVVPGILALLAWWPCYYLVVDQKAAVMDSFGTASMITRGNWLTIFVLWLVGLGISGLGLIACCVGIVVAAPLAGMIYVVAYLMMSGQLPLNPDTRFDKTLVS